MTRRLHRSLVGLAVLALSACGGSETGLFSDVLTAGAGGSGQAGAVSKAGSGSLASSGSASAGTTSVAAAGAGSGGSESAGASSGGTASGGADGSSGSGGVSGNGGATGHAGAAGHAAAGTSSGGASAGGHGGQSGSTSSAGSAGSSNSSCSELLQMASDQLEAARACNVAADAQQCTGKVTNQCGCQVPVQRSDSAETKAYLKTLKQIDDKNCVVVCTAIACVSVLNAQCRAANSSIMGTCVATSRVPIP